MGSMKQLVKWIIFFFLSGAMEAQWACAAMASSFSTSRIKDIASFEGVRSNQLVGYGLVIGLNGTGDKIKKTIFTRESIISMLERLGVNTRDKLETIETANIAAVMITATLPPFSPHGARIDVMVSALGDAKSLMGGTLLATPLVGADGEVYAVAQGPLGATGFSAGGEGASITKGVPTSGRIANGAIVEREIPFRLTDIKNLRLHLHNPDFTTAQRIANAINERMGSHTAQAADHSNVKLQIPSTYHKDVVAFLTEVESLRVAPDQRARVIVDDRNGVIVISENVRISPVAVSHGNITVQITEAPIASQPTDLGLVQVQGGAQAPGGGQQATEGTGGAAQQGAAGITGNITTERLARTQITVSEGEKQMTIVGGSTLQELVSSLNALGVSPQDMVPILLSIKDAGALHADIEPR